MYGIIKTNFTVDEQLRVWKQVIGSNIELNQLCTSPFRSDNNGTCYLRLYKGQILFTDWAYVEFNKFNIIKAVMFFGKSFEETIYDINSFIYLNRPLQTNSFETTVSDKKTRLRKSTVSYNTLRINGINRYTKLTKEYFLKRGITLSQLREDGVEQVINLYLDNTKISIQGLAVAYTFPDKSFKVYIPKSKIRFLAYKINENHIWKWGERTKTAIITKSYKDGRVLYNVLGYKTFAFQNESCLPKILTSLEGFDTIYILYDNDNAGYKGSYKLKTYLETTLVTKSIIKSVFYDPVIGKDTDEIYVTHGEYFLIKQLNQILC